MPIVVSFATLRYVDAAQRSHRLCVNSAPPAFLARFGAAPANYRVGGMAGNKATV
jgi:hypothetical protein